MLSKALIYFRGLAQSFMTLIDKKMDDVYYPFTGNQSIPVVDENWDTRGRSYKDNLPILFNSSTWSSRVHGFGQSSSSRRKTGVAQCHLLG
jgi:hypothetical protein